MIEGLQESINNLSTIILKEKSLGKLKAKIINEYQKIFKYQVLQSIQVLKDENKIYVKRDNQLKFNGYEFGFEIFFDEISKTNFEIKKYTYVAKNDEYYFRFDGDLNEKEKDLDYLVCHPICHLHLKESGNPRIQTAIMSPFDFLRFIKDITNSCKG